MILPQDCHEGESREQRGRVSGGIGLVAHAPPTFTGHVEREVGVLPKRRGCLGKRTRELRGCYGETGRRLRMEAGCPEGSLGRLLEVAVVEVELVGMGYREGWSSYLGATPGLGMGLSG